MPLHILPEPRDLVAESRGRVHQFAEQANSVAHQIRCLREELRRIRTATQELRDRDHHLAQAAGRHVAAASLAVALFLASWVVDFIVLSPLADFMLDWATIPANRRMPIRIAFAFIWTVFGYGIGAKLGIGIQSRQRAAWFDLLPAVAYVLALPVIAYFVGGPVFQGPARWMLIPMTVVLSSVPVLSGYFFTTAAEYLVFLIRIGARKRRERHLQQAINRVGGKLVVISQRLAVAVTQHDQRFRERPQPYLTELAQRLIQEFSRGNITVTIDEAQPLPSPMPQPLPAAHRNGGAPHPASEQQPIQGSQTPTGGEGVEVHQDGQLEYLREQLARRAQAEDSELAAPTSFSQRLP